ncbi:sensor histidine kinase [Streptomyces sp. NPDC015131]|uniref:sensor histidine kinase n=1 Tax=Streptomyces sp. NPDC015131 TaxID=3364941 RepID=UPI0036F8AB80
MLARCRDLARSTRFGRFAPFVRDDIGVVAVRRSADEAVAANEAMHRLRALRAQGVMRLFIVAALCVNLYAFPPLQHPAASLAITAGYGAWSLVVLVMSWSTRTPAFKVWWPLVVDLAAITALIALSGNFSDPDWSSPLTEDAFFLLPLLAAFLLQPAITAVAGVCAACAYVAGVAIGHRGDNPYWHSSLLHAFLILVVAAGGVLLSHIQQSRVRLILTLAGHRSRLLAQVMSAEERERNELAEALHDGAVQTVLAARHEMEEGAGADPHPAFVRADRLLQEATGQLRSSIKVLHSEVLETSGLARALDALAQQTAARGGLAVDVECGIDSAGPADRLLYRAARELLSNVVKHAGATRATVTLDVVGPGTVRLVVADDGGGIVPEELYAKVRAGHIGLASQRICVESAGGTLSITPGAPRGTRVTVLLPALPAPEPVDGARTAAAPSPPA